jgi:hypothetical protein
VNYWIFEVTDNATDVIRVLGEGEAVEEAEADADTKWHAAMSVRADYQDRLPIALSGATLSTYAEEGALPSLVV